MIVEQKSFPFTCTGAELCCCECSQCKWIIAKWNTCTLAKCEETSSRMVVLVMAQKRLENSMAPVAAADRFCWSIRTTAVAAAAFATSAAKNSYSFFAYKRRWWQSIMVLSRRRLFCCRHILWTCLEQCFLSARPLTRKKRVCCMDTQKMNWIPAKSALSISANLLLSAKEVAKRREKRYTFLPEEYHHHHHHHHHPCVYFWCCRCTLSPNIGVYGNGGAIKRKTHSGKIWSTEEQDSCTTPAAAAC